MKINRKITYLLVLFLILDTCYSSYQFYYLPHDGDMAAIIVPAEWYADVLKDPFGIKVLTEGKSYSGTNRFFAHWSLGAYFKTVPLALQIFTSPLQSSYLASALARLGTQLLLIWILATTISGNKKWWSTNFLLSAALLAPLFQTEGYFDRMNIIGHSITYSFFYELSVALLMLYFLPFFNAFHLQKPLKLNFPEHLILIALAIMLPLEGPLNAPLILLICPSVLLYSAWNRFQLAKGDSFFKRVFQAISQIPRPVFFHFGLIILVSIYSFYVGTFNNENDYSVSLPERYSRLPKGLYMQMVPGGSFLIIGAVIAFNLWLLRKFRPNHRLFLMLAVTAIYSIIYIGLLPMGGYRSYRPNIISSHLLIPVTLAFIFFYGYTTFLILKEAEFPQKKYYITGILLLSLVFSIAERPNDVSYRCEKAAIEQIAASPLEHVDIDTWCGVLSWGKITNPYFSVPPGKLLQHWGVTKEAKTYTTGK